MITIGSLGSAPHKREISSSPRNAVYLIIFLRTPTARTGIATWTKLSQSTQIFSRKCLLGDSRFAKKFLGVIFAPKLKRFLTAAKA
jgi:hypothetical protein